MLIIVPERNLYVPPRRIHRPSVPCGHIRAPGHDEIIVPRSAFTYVGTNNNVNTGSGTTLSLTYSATAGSLIVIWNKHEGTPTTITNSDGTNTFSAGTKVNHSNNDLSSQWHYLLVGLSGSLTYTQTLAASRAFRTIILFEYSYTGTASLDQQATAQGSSTAPNSGNLTTTGTDQVSFGGYGEYSTATVTNPLINGAAADGSVLLGSGNFTAAWRKTFAATYTGAASCTLSGSADWICNQISFKATAGGATIYTRKPLTSPIFNSRILQ